MKRISKHISISVCALGTLAWSGASQASGFSVPEMSAVGLGLSNAMVANTREAGAVPYNPAVMVLLGDASVGAGGLLISPNLEVSDTFLNPGKSFDSDAPDWIASGFAHGHVSLNEVLGLGISINSPFGLQTNWPSAAFASGFAAVGAAGAEPTLSELELVSASPSLAYKINDNAAVAAGFDLYWARQLFFNTPANGIDGDGTGTGWHLSGILTRGDWSLGAAYFSSTELDIEGNVAGIPAETDLELPWRFQVGARYQATDQLGVEVDFTRTGWSTFDKLVISHADLGVPLVTSANNWDDANAYRLGVTYDLSDATSLFFGYTFDETPQDDEHFSARIPDADRHLFSLGVSHELAGGWNLEGGYMYVNFKDR
ncbi:MAG: porin, partial [Pseudomonadota bacterium]